MVIAFVLALPLLALAASVLFTTLHILEESKFGGDAPFWRYYRGHFGWGVSDLVGKALFFGLWAAQVGLAIAGYLYGHELLLGGLIGARWGDALLSHGFLRWRLRGPNPGLLSSPCYVAEGLLTPFLFDVSLTGAAIGFGVFAGFWLFSFAVRNWCGRSVGIALLLLTASALSAGAAPVPPAPKELPTEMLVGSWRYRYGSHTDGRIWFFPDGTYTAHHVAGGVIYYGEWWVRGKCVELRERTFNPESGTEYGPTSYRFDFTRGLSHGTCNGQAVALTDRVPLGR